MDKNTQQPVAAQCRFEGEQEWKPCTIAHHLLVKAHPKEWPHYETRALFAELPAPPVPRDVLMAFGEAVREQTLETAWQIGKGKLRSAVDLAAIADRYASQVQPEPVLDKHSNEAICKAIEREDSAAAANKPQCGAIGFASGWTEGGEDGAPIEFMVTAYGEPPPAGTKLYAQPVAVPDGYVLVPVEPTPEMFNCLVELTLASGNLGDACRRGYRAELDAARYRWCKDNPDSAASVFDNLGPAYFDSEIDMLMQK